MTDEILVSPTDAELARAVEGNLFALFRSMMALPDSEMIETDKLSYHHSFPSNPMFKGVWQTNLSANEADAVIEETLAWFKARNAPFIFWWVGSDTRPSDMAERLEAHGVMANIVGDPGMALDLHTLPDEAKLPDGMEVVRVADEQALAHWRDTFVEAFEVPEWAGQAWYDATLRLGFDNTRWKLYIGYLNGKPAATNILLLGAGVAGVYGVGTIPEARRKGMGTAIMLRPLLEARAQGYHHGVLFATEDGYQLYRHMGYRELDCKVGRYLWRNA